jgi:putative spermidine/putrescine transport system permease protein
VAAAIPAVFLSITPILFLFLWAVCGTSTLGVLDDPTLQWVTAVVTDQSWLLAFAVSGFVALVASAAGLYLAATTGFFVKTRLDNYERIATCVILLPLLVPSIVYGLSVQYLGGLVSSPQLLTVLLADISLVLPIQYLVIRSAHGNIPLSQLEAALTLGATPRQALFRVYFPVMARPLIAAWAFGFFTIVDEVVVLKFVWGATDQPTALKLWSLIGKTLNPTPAVVAIVVLTVSGLVIAGMAFVKYRHRLARRWRRFVFGEA